VFILATERERRESQRDAVLFLIMPLLTAFPSALLTARICREVFSPSLDAIAWRAFFIKDRILDLISLLRSRAFRLCRCLFTAEVWTIKGILQNKARKVTNISLGGSQC
jgi:hypothetical protein